MSAHQDRRSSSRQPPPSDSELSRAIFRHDRHVSPLQQTSRNRGRYIPPPRGIDLIDSGPRDHYSPRVYHSRTSRYSPPRDRYLSSYYHSRYRSEKYSPRRRRSRSPPPRELPRRRSPSPPRRHTNDYHKPKASSSSQHGDRGIAISASVTEVGKQTIESFPSAASSSVSLPSLAALLESERIITSSQPDHHPPIKTEADEEAIYSSPSSSSLVQNSPGFCPSPPRASNDDVQGDEECAAPAWKPSPPRESSIDSNASTITYHHPEERKQQQQQEQLQQAHHQQQQQQQQFDEAEGQQHHHHHEEEMPAPPSVGTTAAAEIAVERPTPEMIRTVLLPLELRDTLEKIRSNCEESSARVQLSFAAPKVSHFAVYYHHAAEAIAQCTNITDLSISSKKKSKKEESSGTVPFRFLTPSLPESNLMGFESLLDVISTHSTLKALEFGECDLSSGECSALNRLVSAVNSNTILRTLDLRGNNFSPSLGGSILREMIATNHSLTELKLNDNVLADAGVWDLASALERNRTLVSLDLVRNSIGDIGAHCIAKILTVNTTLLCLDLSNNEIGDSGAMCLALSLRRNTTLDSLYLEDNQIEAEAAQWILQASSEKTLISLYGNPGEHVTRMKNGNATTTTSSSTTSGDTVFVNLVPPKKKKPQSSTSLSSSSASSKKKRVVCSTSASDEVLMPYVDGSDAEEDRKKDELFKPGSLALREAVIAACALVARTDPDMPIRSVKAHLSRKLHLDKDDLADLEDRINEIVQLHRVSAIENASLAQIGGNFPAGEFLPPRLVPQQKKRLTSSAAASSSSLVATETSPSESTTVTTVPKKVTNDPRVDKLRAFLESRFSAEDFQRATDMLRRGPGTPMDEKVFERRIRILDALEYVSAEENFARFECDELSARKIFAKLFNVDMRSISDWKESSILQAKRQRLAVLRETPQIPLLPPPPSPSPSSSDSPAPLLEPKENSHLIPEASSSSVSLTSISNAVFVASNSVAMFEGPVRLPDLVASSVVPVSITDLEMLFRCPICLCLPRHTMCVMECLHRFCAACISKALRHGKKECPVCKSKCASKRNLRKDTAFDALVRNMLPHATIVAASSSPSSSTAPFVQTTAVEEEEAPAANTILTELLSLPSVVPLEDSPPALHLAESSVTPSSNDLPPVPPSTVEVITSVSNTLVHSAPAVLSESKPMPVAETSNTSQILLPNADENVLPPATESSEALNVIPLEKRGSCMNCIM